jgi:hypothetical protein
MHLKNITLFINSTDAQFCFAQNLLMNFLYIGTFLILEDLIIIKGEFCGIVF